MTKGGLIPKPARAAEVEPATNAAMISVTGFHEGAVEHSRVIAKRSRETTAEAMLLRRLGERRMEKDAPVKTQERAWRAFE